MNDRELLRRIEKSAGQKAGYKQLIRELGLAEDRFSDDELISLMAKNPDLIQRPIIERGKRAVLGRPIENARGLIFGDHA